MSPKGQHHVTHQAELGNAVRGRQGRPKFMGQNSSSQRSKSLGRPLKENGNNYNPR